MENKITTIDEYIASCPEELRPRLEELRSIIKNTVPDATEKISWQMPTFYKNGNIVHFALHKKHIGLYPGPDAIEHYAKELENHKTSKGAVQLPLSEELPKELIVKIVTYSANKE